KERSERWAVSLPVDWRRRETWRDPFAGPIGQCSRQVPSPGPRSTHVEAREPQGNSEETFLYRARWGSCGAWPHRNRDVHELFGRLPSNKQSAQATTPISDDWPL